MRSQLPIRKSIFAIYTVSRQARIGRIEAPTILHPEPERKLLRSIPALALEYRKYAHYSSAS
jgi:hypothetical protein